MSPFILKSDVFGTITRVNDTVVRDTRPARPWARPLARYLMRREQRALTRLAADGGTDGIPRVLAFERGLLTRSWIEAAPMHLAKPRDPAYFRAAARLVRRLHAASVIHNDLAKETNWLVTPDGRPALVDFQLAMTLSRRLTVKDSPRLTVKDSRRLTVKDSRRLTMKDSPQLTPKTPRRRGAIARALGHDDIRHLLKHKRTYLPERLTARERRILATPSLLSRAWMASGKQVYLFVTRRILRWRDREGAGDRL